MKASHVQLSTLRSSDHTRIGPHQEGFGGVVPSCSFDDVGFHSQVCSLVTKQLSDSRMKVEKVCLRKNHIRSHDIYVAVTRHHCELNDLGKLKYVHLCIKETNRLYAVVPGISRLLEKPYEIDGKLVPEENFDPLRFTSENIKDKSPYAYVPFSAEPRNCIGQSFALAEIKTALAMILRKFELSIAPQNIVPDEDLQPHLILRAKNGIVVNISPRSNT
ncbi:Cytochrome P450 4B1 [Desmophyllum pertusum]|uniref:Cytochrome P450 4B1 n=1 Tax=Desmophyllum pertusum TaxID=174260 RepID=A0A9W9Z203_9CNID|nr:Cytochrome P450 4B1 [Desmophyllum pertusum]